MISIFTTLSCLDGLIDVRVLIIACFVANVPRICGLYGPIRVISCLICSKSNKILVPFVKSAAYLGINGAIGGDILPDGRWA